MIFQQLINDEAGCLSYLIGCGRAGAAAVVDPGRDRVSDYVALARRKGLTITHVVETHVHADHISGNQALAAQTGPMREAVARLAELPPDRLKAFLCAGGLRSSTVISALKRSGARGPWYNVAGGMTAWQKAGYAAVR